jgi:hypothetical protein
MWKPDIPVARTKGPAERRDSRNMAIRRRLVRGKVTFGILGITVLVVMLGGSVFVSNQVTGMRADIARLDARQDFLEAGSALLLTDWNRATSSEVIIPRAARDLDLEVPDLPQLVLVETGPDEGVESNAFRRLIGRIQGATEARASELHPIAAAGTMVSLQPRGTDGQGGVTP